MTEHKITPPPELVQQWMTEAHDQPPGPDARVIATQAARWGADQQLAEDAKWLDQHALDAPHLKITPVGKSLIEAMRPKPPSLKEQALEELDELLAAVKQLGIFNPPKNIRRALEALPND